MRCGPYEVIGELGRGGMGAVFRARHVETGAEVALKLLTDVRTHDDLRRFAREGEALARLRHPGIVPVHAAGALGGRPWLAMDLLQGESLQRLLSRRGPLDAPTARRVFARLAAALEHAHGQGVVHRDLKPDNVMIDALGEPRLVDFGLAHVGDRSRLTRTGDVLGTPAFMAPEQVRGDASAHDRRTDVYGLGATLYAALTGHPPFAGGTLAVLELVLSRPPRDPAELRPDVDPELAALCLACLEKDPARRPASAAAVARALEGRAPRRRARRGRRWPLALSLGVVAAGAAAVWGTVRREPEESVPPVTATSSPPAAPTTAPPPSPPTPPDPIGAHVERAGALETAGDLAGALAALTSALELAPDRADLQVRRGLLRLKAGELQGALDDLLAALDRAPSAEGYAARARLRGGLDPAGAEADVLAALSLDPRSVEARVTLAALHDRVGDAARARAEVDEALRLAPADVEARRLSAKLHFGRGEFQAGLDDLEVALRERPDDPELLSNRASARSWLHEDEGAVADLRRVQDLTGGLAFGEFVVLAKACMRLKRWADAEAAYARALALLPGDQRDLEAELRTEHGQVRARALNLRALEAQARGDLARAIALLTEAVALDPAFGNGWFNRGQMLLEANEPQAALADIETSLRLDDDVDGRSARAITLLRLGDGPRALLDLDAVIARTGPQREALLARGMARWLSGDGAGALADADAACRANPRDPIALAQRAETRLALGDARGAERDAEAALAVAPRAPLLLVLRGRTRSSLGRHEGATADLDAAVRLDPTSPIPLLFRGRHRRQADPAAAQADLARAAALPAGAPRDLWCRAEARAATGDPAGAMEVLRRAAERAPQRADVRKLLGDVALRVGDVEAARGAWRNALDLDPGYAEVWLGLGRLEQERGELKAAEDAFRAALERLPSFAEAAHALAGLLDQMDRAGEALDLLVTTLERDAFDFEALVLLSRVLLDLGHTADAVAAATRVVRFRPDHVAAHYQLGVALARERRYREAVQMWERSIALDPAGPWAARARQHARTAADLMRIFAGEAA